MYVVVNIGWGNSLKKCLITAASSLGDAFLRAESESWGAE